MNTLVIAGGSFILFMVLEWVFWRSPANQFFEKIARRMVWWIQPYYIIRLVTLGGILLFARPKLWPVFSKGEGWFYSLGLGLCLIALSFCLYGFRRRRSGKAFVGGTRKIDDRLYNH